MGIHSAEVVGAEYQNIEVKSGDVIIKKASVGENEYSEEKSQLIQFPDKIEVKAQSDQVKSTEKEVKVAVTVSENQLLEKSKNVQSEVYAPQKAVVKDVKNEETSEVKVPASIEETQTVEKTQLLEKSNNIKTETYLPKKAIVKDVKNEETSEIKIAVSTEETQTVE